MLKKALVLAQSTQIDWGAVEASLHNGFDVNAVSFHKDGQRKTGTDLDPVNGICDLIKKHHRGIRRICGEIQQYMNHEAQVKGRAVTEECDAGMFKIVVPVILEDEIDGFVSTCGRPYVSTDRIYTHFIHEIIDEDEERIVSLLATLVPIDARTVKAIINHITGYA